MLAALPPRWTLHQVRHQLGSRAAATTTLTCRPAPAQTPAVIDHPPLAATPLPLGPGPLTLPGPAVPHPPHRLAIVQQVAAETGYPRSGLSATAFTQRVAERLHAEDARWGRRVNSTGPISDDTVAYQIGDSPHNPFSVDIILGAGGPTRASTGSPTAASAAPGSPPDDGGWGSRDPGEAVFYNARL